MSNNAPLVVFRVLFGLLMAAESFGAMATGWLHRAFVEPRLTFAIFPFEWPKPLPGYGMYGWFAAMGLAAFAVTAGWRYRVSAAILAFLWTGAYLFQKTHYNNHYYLAVAVCWVMVAVPAHRRAAVDAARQRETACPRWLIVAFKVQLLIVFTYAAIAKLYPGWLNGDYLAVALGSRSHRPVIGPLLSEPWFQMFIAYSGVAFDALVIPLLWWSRTRVLAFVGLLIFNLFNSLVFKIGVFPYLVLAWTVFFFDPRTIERLFWWLPGLGRAPEREADSGPMTWPTGGLRYALIAYFAVQVLLPLRHYLIPGDVLWTEEGHRMAWRMMLRHKAGRVTIVARDPSTGETWQIDQTEWLTGKQRRRVATRHDFMYQFVQVLKADFARRGVPEVQIFAKDSKVTINGKLSGPLFDPNVDLARVDYHPFSHSPWLADPPPK